MPEISSSTTFSSVRVSWDESPYSTRISFNTDNGDRETTIRFNSDGTQRSGVGLDVLRNFYGSDDGFVDADGNSIEVEVVGLLYGETIEDLEKYGWNPLDPDAYGRWVSQQEANNLVSRGEEEIEEDSASGRIDRKPKGGVIPQERTPDTDNFDFPLEDISLDTTASRIKFRINIPASEGISSVMVAIPGLDTYNPCIALRLWLNGLRTAGAVVGTDMNVDASFEDRTYSLDQTGGGSAMFFEFHSIATEDTNNNVTSYTLTFLRTSGPSIDEPAIRDVLDTTTVSIPVTTGIEKPHIGSVVTLATALEYRFPDDQKLTGMNGELVWRGVDPDGSPFEVPLDANRSIRYADLLTSGGAEQMTKFFKINTYHFGHSETADGAIRITAPPELLNHESTDKTFGFHNISDTYNLELWDWDDNVFLILTPGQYARVQVLFEADGNGELIIVQAPVRELRWSFGSDDTPRDFGDTPFFDDDDAGFHYWIIPVRSVRDYQDQDSFIVSTDNATETEAVAVDWDSYDWGGSGKDFKQGFTMKAAGKLRVDLTYEIEVTAGAELPELNGPVIYRQTGTDEPDEEEATISPTLTATDGPRRYHIGETFRVEEGDFIFFVHRIDDGNTATRGSVSVISRKLRVEFEPDIRIGYTA